MKPYLTISDLHFHNWSPFSKTVNFGGMDGVNSRLSNTLSSLIYAVTQLKKRGGDTVFITGDVFHVRGSISPTVINPVVRVFSELAEDGTTFHIIPGNHDLESNDSEELSNATQILNSIDGVNVYNSPKFILDYKVLMVPWHEKKDQLKKVINDHKLADAVGECTLMIHAPLDGVIEGIPGHGWSAKELASLGYARVFCGHYHQHKAFDNVYSVGALTHQTWGDAGSLAGGLIVTEESVEHFETKAPKFVDFRHGDDESEVDAKGNFVRFHVGSVSMEEVAELREYIINTMEAHDVVIHSKPTRVRVERSSGVETSSTDTLSESIIKYTNGLKVEEGIDPEELQAECQSILDEAEGVEL